MLAPAAARAFLQEAARVGRLVAYREMASALQVMPPNSIHQVTVALELLMEEDAAANRPLIAALAVSGTLGDLPRRGFFDCARRLGRFTGDPEGPEPGPFMPGKRTPRSLFGAARTSNDWDLAAWRQRQCVKARDRAAKPGEA